MNDKLLKSIIKGIKERDRDKEAIRINIDYLLRNMKQNKEFIPIFDNLDKKTTIYILKQLKKLGYKYIWGKIMKDKEKKIIYFCMNGAG